VLQDFLIRSGTGFFVSGPRVSFSDTSRTWIVSAPHCPYNPLIFGEPVGIRTRDLLIKSQLLYRLSYRLPQGSARLRLAVRAGRAHGAASAPIAGSEGGGAYLGLGSHLSRMPQAV
jgi:hypothetical protein